MAANLPRESVTWQAAHTDYALWGLTEQLLADAVDQLRWLRWAKTKDGSKNRRPPKPIPRPGVGKDTKARKFGADPVPLDELAEFLGWDAEPVIVDAPPASCRVCGSTDRHRDPATGRFTTSH